MKDLKAGINLTPFGIFLLFLIHPELYWLVKQDSRMKLIDGSIEIDINLQK